MIHDPSLGIAGPAWVKLAMLSHGVAVAPSFSSWFSGQAGAVRRRNFYNSPVWDGSEAVPQEIRLVNGSGPPVTVAVNVYGDHTWSLTGTERGPAVVNARLGMPRMFAVQAGVRHVLAGPAGAERSVSSAAETALG